MKSAVALSKERFKSYLVLFFGFGVAIIVPEIMAGIPDKTVIFRKFDLWWPLLTSIFTWVKKWPKWLRTGSLRAVDRRIARPSSFPSFRVRGGGGSFWPPPPTMAKVAETATRARVKCKSQFFDGLLTMNPSEKNPIGIFAPYRIPIGFLWDYFSYRICSIVSYRKSRRIGFFPIRCLQSYRIIFL